ncbi:hypothetical protein DNTS_015388, partial [Danionella cerebrum]
SAKPSGRFQPRRAPTVIVTNVSKPEAAEESFEELLLKYKQIRLELESIRSQERHALGHSHGAGALAELQSPDGGQSEARNDPAAPESGAGATEEPRPLLQEQKISFQAFNLRPLRQKLLTPAQMDALNQPRPEQQEQAPLPDDAEGDDEVQDEESESDLNVSALSEEATPLVSGKMLQEEEDLSELHLRLLALQSASRRWQQKEQQELSRKSIPAAQEKRCMTPAMQRSIGRSSESSPALQARRSRSRSGGAPERSRTPVRPRRAAALSKQALRKQQLRTWKLQRQKQQQERRHREEEIRKIRDLQNQDEQYNRFMRLVTGRGRPHPHSTVSEADPKKPLRQALDSSGNLYQYDNYDEVAMDTDSEPGSPALCPGHDALAVFPLESTPVRQDSSPGTTAPSSPVLKQRINLSAVSLNTVSRIHPRVRKPAHSLPTTKSPFMLPRHRSVVVCLKASDDSDSEGEDGGDGVHVPFGGLESMIREARRTVEAAKPKQNVSEKENNPVKSRVEVVKAVASPLSSDSEINRATELQEKLQQHRASLVSDQTLLQQLRLQQIRKREALSAAEAKVQRLREQLLASEKIANANRLLLRKLQEQVQKVQQRVHVKQQQSLKLESDLRNLKAPGAIKRSTSATTAGALPLKVRRLDRLDSHLSELMVQKQRLQQLEVEYAMKIRKLKAAQALRQAEPRPDPSASDAPPLQAKPHPAAACVPPLLPQPSRHDLTQDKLVLSSDAEEEEEEQPPLKKSSGQRRRSFPESGSATRPKLSHAELPAACTRAPSAGAAGPQELLLGLNVQDLRQRFLQSAGLAQLMREEALNLTLSGNTWGQTERHGKVLEVESEALPSPQSRGDLALVPYGEYHSPLLLFKSYRFSPYYRTKEKLSLRSRTYSHAIDPKKSFCRFDLTGSCNDDRCAWSVSICLSVRLSVCAAVSLKLFLSVFRQHTRNVSLSEPLLFQDLLSYCLPLIGCNHSSRSSEVSSATERYMKRLFGANHDRMETDQKAVLLLSKDDKRYFDSETDDISNLETSVLENPKNTLLWLKLAYKYLQQRDSSESECVDAALNTLSRALEENPEHPELWSHYLMLFSHTDSSREERREMSETAVEHSPHCSVWWSYIGMESSFEGKDYVCSRLVTHLTEELPEQTPESASFQLLEVLVFRTQLALFSGRTRSAVQTLQVSRRSGVPCMTLRGGRTALTSRSAQGALESRVAHHLTLQHRSLLWLCFIYLKVFKHLPPTLFDPVDSNPQRISSTEPVLLPWSSSQLPTESEDLIAMVTDALSRCRDDRLSSAEQIQARFPLHSTLIHLYRSSAREAEAVSVCEQLMEEVPFFPPLLELRCSLMVSGCSDWLVDKWTAAFSQIPAPAQVLYHLGRCLQTQGQGNVLEQLSEPFIFSLCDSVPEQTTALDALRYVLGVQMDLQRVPVIKEEVQQQIEDQRPYLHLLYCQLLCVSGSVREAADGFEKALGSVTKLELLHTLWMDYLSFSRERLCSGSASVRDIRLFSSLVMRCLKTVPSRVVLPYSSSKFWNCFSFHNKVISFYLSCIPQSQHALVLERLHHAMPSNTQLAIRMLQQEYQDGSLEQFQLQSRMMISSFPRCLTFWRIAIAMETEQKHRAEVRRLYRQALRNLPLSATLWKDVNTHSSPVSLNDPGHPALISSTCLSLPVLSMLQWLLFEAADGGGRIDSLRKIIQHTHSLAPTVWRLSRTFAHPAIACFWIMGRSESTQTLRTTPNRTSIDTVPAFITGS